MKICAAQIQSIKGDISRNIDRHLQAIELAAAEAVDIIIFPELSLTNYEPTLAKELAMQPDDKRLDVFKEISAQKQILIGVGAPTISNLGICISMILFQPDSTQNVYAKKHLHADEEPFFVPGEGLTVFNFNKVNIAPAICYEISISDHAANASKSGAEIYLASVAKTASGVESAYKNLSTTARKYSMPVLMANAIGPADNFVNAGESAVWNDRGELLYKLGSKEEGLLIYDTESQTVTKKLIV